VTSSRWLALAIMFCVACDLGASDSREPDGGVRPAHDDAGHVLPMREAPWTPEEVECIPGSRSNGGDGFARGELYDDWSCDPTGGRRYLFTPCTEDAHCGPGGRCNKEQARCPPKVPCDLTDEFRPSGSDPDRWNCEFGNSRHGVCLNTNLCIPLCKTDLDCPGVPCITLGAYSLCEII
jgi:hypothetical protein